VAPKTDKPVIAVLPFDNMSRDAQQDYFSDGITADLITDLSRISGLLVIARNSTFTYKGTPTRVQQVARELGASHVLEGSVRKAGNRIRVSAQLIDGRTGYHLWADKYDRDLREVFALQDGVTQKIIAALSVKLRLNEKQRLSRSPQAHPEAYDMLLRGLEQYRQFTRESIDESRRYFKRAIALDPTFARAHAGLALSYSQAAQLGLSDDPKASIRQALEIAQHALQLDDTVREVHFGLSHAYWLDGNLKKGIAAARRAIALDPNYADAYGMLATNLNYAGSPLDALAAIRKAMQLNPRYPYFYVLIDGQSNYQLGRYKEALKQFERVRTSNPNFPLAHKMLAATYVALGRTDDAQWAAEELRTLIPKFSLKGEAARSPYKDEAVFNLYIDRLRKAGLQ
jgi:adenylate cyclase